MGGLLQHSPRQVTVAHMYDHGLSQLLHDELHWLDVPERESAQYKPAVISCA